MIRYPFPLVDGRVGYVEVPEDITEQDADRVAAMVRALPYEHTEKCEAVVAGFCNAPSVGVVGVDDSPYCAEHIDNAREREARST